MEYPLEELSRPPTNATPHIHRREKNGTSKDGPDEVDNVVVSTDSNTNLPATDEGRDAWLFCVSAFAFEFFIWGWNNTYGIFQDYYSMNPPFNTSSAAAISTIGTASLGIQYFALVLVVLLYQRYPEYIKHGMWASLSLCFLALLLSSFASKIWHMILLQGVVFGLSASTLYSPVMIWLPEWFVTRRGLATGIIFGGSGIGGFVFPLVMGTMLQKLGFRWTLRIWAIVFGLCMSTALLGMKPRVPIRKPGSMTDVPRQPWFPANLSSLRGPVLYGVAAITFVQALGFFPVSLFIPTYTSSLSPATALPSRLVLAVFNVASAIFFMLFGRLSDSYPYPYVIMSSGIGCAVASFVFWGFASSLPWIFVFASVFGGFGGAFPGIWPAAASEIGGTQNHITNIAFGCFASVEGLTSIVGPIIAASLRDKRNKESKALYGGFGFRTVELFVGSMGLGTMIGGFILLFYSTSKRKVS